MTEEEDIHAIALTLVRGLGPRKIHRLLGHFGSAVEVFRACRRRLPLNNNHYPNIFPAQDLSAAADAAKQILSRCRKSGISVISTVHTAYPIRLAACPDPPAVLYVLGKPVWNAQRLLAVVGSRNASAYGRSVVNAIIGDISGCLPVIVSGLASGIDAAAHQASLEHELITIAVMAHGLDMVYPYGHRRMAERILASGGALISEYPPGTKPDRYRFPARNRIIAGISDGVLVAESTSRGGGMITAGLADSYFREVFAVPGRIGDERSEGCNDLISGHLAHLVCSGRDLAAVLNWTGCIREATGDTDHLSGKAVLTAEEYSVLEKIRRHGPLHLEILAASGLSQRLSEILLRLEIDGLIRALPGPVYEC